MEQGHNGHDLALGIDVGSTSIKVCLLAEGRERWSEVRAHDGDLPGTVRALLGSHHVPAGVPTMVTGAEGRRQLRIDGIIAPVAVERALSALGEQVGAVVSVGGEDLVVYTVDGDGRIVNTYAGNKCASGTGEFFAQQLKRMDLGLDAVAKQEVHDASVYRLSSRCSVFMKSDCTHKLNKGEADKHDIVLSLSHVMSRKVVEFLTKARIEGGRVLFVGGATKNPHLVRFVREQLPDVEFVVPPEAPYLEAFGAAHLARQEGRPLPALDALMSEADVVYARGEPLSKAADKVTFAASRRSPIRAGRTYVMGVDGGSTTTKVALIDPETKEIVASHYGRTLGDPVAALKDCLRRVRAQVRDALGPDARIPVSMVSTTGSSRELLGVFCGTQAVFNEIIAHTAGTTFFDPDIDTIFEIGGQDAKYVHLRNNVPVDYAMNEACSAGTGSFLEESASGDLDIHRADEIGPVAMAATNPLKFGEHCSAFINSDIRKAIQQGATREDIVAGLVLSIVSNYLNRVVGNRRTGNRIVLQGGVAKNPAVANAFALLLDKPILVPPDPELMGCFGVALLAIKKEQEGLLQPQPLDIDELLQRTIVYEKEFRCRACDNDCPIRLLRAGEIRYAFGGRCNKYANQRKKTEKRKDIVDWVDTRHTLFFDKYAGKARPAGPSGVIVAVPDAFSVHSLWPLYSTFFATLGVEVRLESNVSDKGVARCESSYCYPAEIAHGTMASAVASDAHYWFVPHFKAMESTQDDAQACLCPLTQGAPYYLRTAFGLEDRRILKPLIDFSQGYEAGAEPMIQVGVQLGFSRGAAAGAFERGVAAQKACLAEMHAIGARVIQEAEAADRPVIVLCGRPYNALTSMANMGIPRKFSTRGYSVLPFDFLPVDDETIFPNMYWHYGQQDLKAATAIKRHKNLFACYVTNFSCAPDSFILHYLRWISNTKPFLVLELDSHTADAGLDTRIEAFLDIIEGYRRAKVTERPMMVERDWDVVLEADSAHLVHTRTGERVALQDPRVQLVWPSMDGLTTRLIAQAARCFGIDSVALRPSDVTTAARARAVASGKECIPALLVLGSFLEFFSRTTLDPNRIYLLFMPLTTGPCRTGQYAVFYQNLFQELGYTNVCTLSLNSDNSYMELGKGFNRRAWVNICVGDVMRDIETSLRAVAVDTRAAQRELDDIKEDLVEAAGGDSSALIAALPAAAERIARIPVKRKAHDARKVLVVGEIFVRRDDYSVETLVSHLAERGIVAKITGLAEWIHYLDWDQVRKNKAALAGKPRWLQPFAPELRKLAWLEIEMRWKDYQEHRILNALGKTGLVPDAPHGMKHIMARASEFTTPELESEATLSPCVASIAMEEGWDGVAVIAPFACLPGRLIEALYAPWARSRGMPILCLENDGNPYPPNVVSRIEVFAHNVRRGARGAGMMQDPITIVPDSAAACSGGCATTSACGTRAGAAGVPVGRLEGQRAGAETVGVGG